MSKTVTIDVTQPFVKSLVAKLDKAEVQRDQLLSAAKAALPTIQKSLMKAQGNHEQELKGIESGLRAAIAAAESKQESA